MKRLKFEHRLVKANLPAPEKQAEAALLVGCMYEVGRQLLERGHPDKARRYFRGAIKKDRSFLPAYIGMGEILLHEGKTKDAVEILKKVYSRTRSVIILHRLEELFLDKVSLVKSFGSIRRLCSKTRTIRFSSSI